MSRIRIVWLVASLTAVAVLGSAMFFPEQNRFNPIDRTAFLPGETTDGHYQIEIECGACHTTNLTDSTAIQEACVGCHAAELEYVDDSHSTSKFTDPRNADRIAVLDARLCATCHQEHRPELTSTMGLSLPTDYCYRCHDTIAKDRPTHADLPFSSCASGGCHNFHDNRALYEDFLVEHRSEPDYKQSPQVRARTGSPSSRRNAAAPLEASAYDAPSNLTKFSESLADWEVSAHAEGGVNCSSCHGSENAWKAKPSPDVCVDCHSTESETFQAGRHGMRLASGSLR